MTEDASSPRLDEAVTAFETRYRRYLDDMADVKKQTSNIRVASTFFTQKRPFADDPVHVQALADLTALAQDVASSISTCTAEGESLARLTRLVLGKKDINQPEYWPLVSLEGLAKPWLKALTRTDLEAISKAYFQVNPRFSCLPNQRRIRQEFERLLKAR